MSTKEKSGGHGRRFRLEVARPGDWIQVVCACGTTRVHEYGEKTPYVEEDYTCPECFLSIRLPTITSRALF